MWSGCGRSVAARVSLPAWAEPARGRVDATVVITPGGIATALAHLGIPAMNRAVKDGWQVEFSTPPVRVNRRGYQAVFSLPMGVTPDMIADKRDVLARNLVRAPLEVWPAAADHAGYVDLWVADPGATERAAPPYPLLHDGRVDVFTGVPLGVSQRGDVITIELPGANLVYGGLMGQGKSNAARVTTMLGAALDPLAVLWVFVFANNGDFDAYQPRLARYHRGVDDHVAEAAFDGLRELYSMVSDREGRLADLGAKKVTRTLAERHVQLRPVVALFSECHELFGHPGFGQEAADLAAQVLRRGREAAVTLAFDTQSSRADAIPPRIVELVKMNACFAVRRGAPTTASWATGRSRPGSGPPSCDEPQFVWLKINEGHHELSHNRRQRQAIAGEAHQDQPLVLRAARVPRQAAGRDAGAGRQRQPARQHADRLDQRAGQGQLAHARQHPVRAGRQRPRLQDGPLAQVQQACRTTAC